MPSDLVLNPDFPLEVMPTYSTIITKYENGIEQRRPRRSASLTEFTLKYQNRSQTDMDTINALFSAKQGSFASFTWDNPQDSVTYTVRFKDDSFKAQYKSYGLWDFQFTLVKVI